MKLLAIDTSTAQASVALVSDTGPLAEHTWWAGQNHGNELLPRINMILNDSRCTPLDIEAVGVALGPGSFNGLRVALATAKGIALARNVPIVGIPTPAVAAAPHVLGGRTVVAVQEAGRGEIYVTWFTERAGELVTVEDTTITTAAELVQRLTSQVVLCGEWNEGTITALRAQAMVAPLVVPPAGRRRLAAVLAELALTRLARGDHDNALALEPLYIRRPAITQSRRPLVAVLATEGN